MTCAGVCIIHDDHTALTHGLSLDTGKLSYLTINADPGSMYMCLHGSNVRENDENVVQKYALESGDLFPFAEKRASTHSP